MSLILIIALTSQGLYAAVPEPQFTVDFNVGGGRVEILAGGEHFATYVYADPEIPRPYFCRVAAPGGIQVTRNHPPHPIEDAKNDDHATFHPGLWLAFGDLGGADFWRNKARVRHVHFEDSPQSGDVGTFTVKNVYETPESPPRIICTETCRYMVLITPTARWIIAESQLQAVASEVAFGDQEEMGFGVRMATPLTVKHGNGTIINDLGGQNEPGTWGKQADWCAYSGVMDGRRIGILLAANPGNFRRSWFHNRDYGLMVANPFGKKSMTAPRDRTVLPDSTPLPLGNVFSLGFGVCVFAEEGEQHPDYGALYDRYINLLIDPNPKQ